MLPTTGTPALVPNIPTTTELLKRCGIANAKIIIEAELSDVPSNWEERYGSHEVAVRLTPSSVDTAFRGPLDVSRGRSS